MVLEELAHLDALLGRAQRDRLLVLGVTHGEEGRRALAAATDDRARLRKEAHRLRGAVAPFGVPALTALLLRAETGEEVTAPQLDAALTDFVQACRDALA